MQVGLNLKLLPNQIKPLYWQMKKPTLPSAIMPLIPMQALKFLLSLPATIRIVLTVQLIWMWEQMEQVEQVMVFVPQFMKTTPTMMARWIVNTRLPVPMMPMGISSLSFMKRT